MGGQLAMLVDAWISKLDKEEREAIGKLFRLAKVWPKSLMLYANSGALEILRMKDDKSAPLGSKAEHDAYLVADLGSKIIADGGDPND